MPCYFLLRVKARLGELFRKAYVTCSILRVISCGCGRSFRMHALLRSGAHAQWPPATRRSVQSCTGLETANKCALQVVTNAAVTSPLRCLNYTNEQPYATQNWPTTTSSTHRCEWDRNRDTHRYSGANKRLNASNNIASQKTMPQNQTSPGQAKPAMIAGAPRAREWNRPHQTAA